MGAAGAPLPFVVQPGDANFESATRGAELRLVLLGTSGGPPWWHGSTRRGVSSAVAVGEAIYLVDCGEGWGPQYRRAGLGAPGFMRGIETLRGVFLTHLHSDHVVDYSNLVTLAWHNGGQLLQQPIQIYGPGDRGALPPVFGAPEVEPAVVSPEDPTPGTVSMTNSLLRSYAADLNDRIRDYRNRPIEEMFEVQDIALPLQCGQDPNGDPAPDMEPILVHEDDRVRVSAVLVNHAPVFPAYAFRFDTDHGSIVFSGDTCPCDNLVTLAAGADVLVHEVIDRQWVEQMFTDPTESESALVNHLLAAHTTIEQVGPVAQGAEVKTLVLNHLVPGNNDPAKWRRAQVGFDGQLVVGEDLMQIVFPPA